MADPQSTLTIPQLPSGVIVAGDTFTVAGVYWTPWWKRLLYRLGLMRRPAASPFLQQFVVTDVGAYAWPSGVLIEPWHKADPGIEAPGGIIVKHARQP